MDIRRRMLFKKKASSSGGGGSTTGGSYTVNLNSQWEKTTAVTNPDSTLYDGVYRSSSNYNVNSGVATMYITIKDCSSFKMYIRSYAESYCDYVMVSQLDQTINGSTSYSDTTLVKAHTRVNQQSGTALSSYTLVEFTGITSGAHTITVVYRKDGSVNNGDDRGYVLIEKMQAGSGDSGSGGDDEGGSSEGPINTNNYLTIEARENGLTASLSTNACEYCVDGDGNWKTLSAGTATQSINTRQTLSFRGNLTPNSSVGIGTFTISKKCNLKGNCMSMLFRDNAANNYSLSGKNYAFYQLFKNCTNIVNVSSNFLPANVLSEKCYCQMFWECSEFSSAPTLPATTLSPYCYNNMFYNCSNLTTPPELPATTLSEGCYYSMFRCCSNLTTPPELPATTLSKACYNSMFEECSNLIASPYLHASILSERCYGYMFYNCHMLKYITMLATNISSSCLDSWVNGVASTGTFVKNPAMTSLPTGVNGIPSGWTVVNDGEESVNIDNYLTIEALEDGLTASLSTNACEYCIDGDGDWKSLAAGTATEAINTGQTLSFRGELTPNSSNGIGKFTISKKCNLKGNCMSMLFSDYAANNYGLDGKDFAFYKLFQNCTNIVTVSSNFLPATYLSYSCYYYMFYGCTGLTTAPELPATTLADYCYDTMFGDCTNLTTAPELPATTLADKCYHRMFYGCTSLVNAPELPATTLADSCYCLMLYNCTSLTTAPELPATTLAEYCYNSMFRDCSKLNYIKMLATDISASYCLNTWVRSVSSSGTFVKNPAMTSLPTATSSNGYVGIPSGWTVVNDGEPVIDINNYLTIEALEDGLTASLSTNACEYCVNGNGNWKSLSAGTATESINTGQTLSFRGELTPTSSNGIGTFSISKKCNLKGNCMSMLFGDNAVSNTSLNGKSFAFYKLFSNCSNIVTVNSHFLPATVVSSACYDQMFMNCTSLTTAPELPTTTLQYRCYRDMFYGCTGLTTAPELPATTLADYCYSNMFHGCTNLTTAPELPATTLVNYCYNHMFYACYKLNYIKMLATDISALNCLSSWVYYVASSGTFVKNPAMNSLPTGASGIPSGWTVQNA